jgi:SAM-dependent methyltransferase
MKLIPENKLIWSPVVANSRMNRERNASGINSYEQEFKFKPEEFLQERIERFGMVSWLDLCCGYGKAMNQVAEYFIGKNLQDCIRFTGVDLVGDFIEPVLPSPFIVFEAGSVIDFEAKQKYDLITSVHGLHYIGDKLKVISSATSFLHESGLFIANLDAANIVIKDIDTKKLLREKGLDYNARTKILQRTGTSDIRFDLKYLGADDTIGPNYTGQESVNSCYAPIH